MTQFDPLIIFPLMFSLFVILYLYYSYQINNINIKVYNNINVNNSII